VERTEAVTFNVPHFYHCSEQKKHQAGANEGRLMLEEVRFHSGGYKDFCHLGYNPAYSVGSQPTFRKNISPSSGLNHEISMKQAASLSSASADFLHVSLLVSEDGSVMF
jgi:hypothetical protein